MSAAHYLHLAPPAVNDDHFSPHCEPSADLLRRMWRAGHLVRRGSNHDFLVIHKSGNMTRHLQDAAALRKFAEILGVCHG